MRAEKHVQLLKNLRIISFNFKSLDLEKVGFLHIDTENQKARLSQLKKALNLDEILYLSTCNRIELILVSNCFSDDFERKLLLALYPQFNPTQIKEYVVAAQVFDGMKAVEHFLRVSTSIDSMVVGEREIITQVRTAFENGRKMGLTGDFIRILIRNNIETAKKVYTETTISTKPVSIVSLAHHRIKNLDVPLDTRILIIGAGGTNTTMCRLLAKRGFHNFAVFNRTFSKAEQFAMQFGGKAYPLSDLASYTEGFDAIITCTGAEGFILTKTIYKQLVQNDTSKKMVIDLAVPCDFDASITKDFNVKHISVEHLREISKANQEERAKEIDHVEQIIQAELNKFVEQHRTRQVEIAMREVPETVKEIRANAIDNVFAQEIADLDEKSREVLEKVIGFMEKKYISIPMKIAKRIMVETAHKN